MADVDVGQELIDAFRAAVDALRAVGCRPVVFGGIAANVRGRARFTDDADIATAARSDQHDGIIRELAARGLALPGNAAERLRRDSMLPCFFGKTKVDLLLADDPLSAALVENAPDESLYDRTVGVARPEELIAMKLLAGRVQDVEDVKAMLVANRDRLDFTAIERWLPELEAWSPGATDLFRKLKKEFHDPL